jgi:hypothetical protein
LPDRERAQEREHPAIAFLFESIERDASGKEVARAQAELLAAEDAAVDRDPRSTEAAGERQAGRQEPENEHRALRVLIPA